MIRTQIQLPDGDYQDLRRAAQEEERSMADCIREAIRLFLSRRRTAKTDIREFVGKFRPRGMKDLKPHDRWFAEAILASKKGGKRKG